MITGNFIIGAALTIMTALILAPLPTLALVGTISIGSLSLSRSFKNHSVSRFCLVAISATLLCIGHKYLYGGASLDDLFEAAKHSALSLALNALIGVLAVNMLLLVGWIKKDEKIGMLKSWIVVSMLGSLTFEIIQGM